MDLRFRHDLSHENGRNSLNFLDRGGIFWTFSYLNMFKNTRHLILKEKIELVLKIGETSFSSKTYINS